MVRAPELARWVSLAEGAAVTVRKGNAIDVGREGLEASFIRMYLAGQRHGHVGASMEGIFKADDGRTLGVGTRKLDGVLHRFCAAIRQKGFLGKFSRGQPVKSFRQCNV